MPANKMKIAVVVSRFNHLITERLFKSAERRFIELNMQLFDEDVVWVPGAVEIPLASQQFARAESYAAIIGLGCVIRGETDHYDYVCSQVSEGCQNVALAHNIPVIFGVLTTDNAEQALARSGGEHSNKGQEAVDAAIEMITVMRRFQVEVCAVE